MSLILLTVTLSGALFSKLLYILGIESMAMRYALCVLLAYFILIVLVRIWLWYISPSRRLPDISAPDVDFSLGSSGSSTSEAGSAFRGAGGSYGGGGASASFGASSSGSSSGGGGKFSIGSLDIGDAGEGILIILLLLVVLAVTGAWVYLIIEAPAILGEAAFEFGLGGSLFRRIKKIHTGNWAGSIIKSTVIPAVIIFILAGAFGYASDTFCPGKHKLIPVIKECIL